MVFHIIAIAPRLIIAPLRRTWEHVVLHILLVQEVAGAGIGARGVVVDNILPQIKHIVVFAGEGEGLVGLQGGCGGVGAVVILILIYRILKKSASFSAFLWQFFAIFILICTWFYSFLYKRIRFFKATIGAGLRIFRAVSVIIGSF